MKYVILLCISFVLGSCMQPLEKTSSTQKFLVKGSINGDFSGPLVIKYDQKMDTLNIENNSFSLKGEVNSPKAFRFVFDSLNTSEVFYLENDTLIFDLIIDESSLEDSLLKNHIINQIHGGETPQLRRYIKDLLATTPKSKSNRDLLHNTMDSLIKAHPNHDYLGKVLSELSMSQDLLYNDIRSLISEMDIDFLNPEDVAVLENYQHKRRKFQIGSQLPDFKLQTLSGEKQALKTNLSTYTLLSFSNAWCDACESKQEQLMDIYKRFKYKGFEIVDISVDTNEEDWKRKLFKSPVPWKVLRVEGGFTGPLPTEMGIIDLPQYYLVDASGRIVEINLSVNELHTILKALLK